MENELKGADLKDIIEKAVSSLDEKTKNEHDKCVAEGLKDEFCSKCGRLFLAHQHFVRCIEKQCPMSNGKTFFDMWTEVMDENDEDKKLESIIITEIN